MRNHLEAALEASIDVDAVATDLKGLLECLFGVVQFGVVVL